MVYRAGRHFLQIPGPSPVPDRISRAIDGVIDHRELIFQTWFVSSFGYAANFQNPVSCCDLSKFGTGAWEACLLNVLKAGDQVLFYETGHFATLWKQMAVRLGIETEFLAGIGAMALMQID